LLAFSRQQVLTPTVLNLNTLILEMERMLPRLLGEDIEVSLTLDPELVSVKADLSQIEQVVMNLAVNARDAMPTGGRLEIRTSAAEIDQTYLRTHPGSRVGTYVLLTVSDSGTGMDPETLAHIFEPFFTTKELGKGTGLGLATVYGIVKQSNGYIWVSSVPGKGSAFEVYLPRYVGRPATEEARANPEERLCGSESILLVEDAEPLRKLAKIFLEGGGFRVLSAACGAEALEMAARYPATLDLLLTDVVMPGINGRVLAEQLSLRRPKMKVLYMSGYTDSFIAGHGVRDQEIQLLHKPFTEEVLIRKVREVLDGGKTAASSPRTVVKLVERDIQSGQ
jgi:CheY-like chemotaxis protein